VLLCASQVKGRLTRSHAEVVAALASVRQFFEGDSEEVQREWVRYTAKVDKKLEDALR